MTFSVCSVRLYFPVTEPHYYIFSFVVVLSSVILGAEPIKFTCISDQKQNSIFKTGCWLPPLVLCANPRLLAVKWRVARALF